MKNLTGRLCSGFWRWPKRGRCPARLLGQSQPTVGRQIKNIERSLGVNLFQRQPKGLLLNDTGHDLLAYAAKMRESAAQIAGRDEKLHGVVRITASVVVSPHYMPKIIAEIRLSQPDIEIELAPTDITENLLFREADIAIRMVEPVQLDIIAKKLGVFKMGLFASRAYLARKDMPENHPNLAQHDFVGLDKNTQIIDGMRSLGIAATRSTFMVRCDFQSVCWELVRAGCAIGVTHSQIAMQDNEMVPVLQGTNIDDLPVWLAASKALRNSPRIRRVYDLWARKIAMLTDA